MADDTDGERAAREETTAPHPAPRRRKRWGLGILAGLVLVPLLLLSLWTAITLNFDYSTGERAGYIQKFSRKGWLCKTWEGEIAMVSIPGTPPQIFPFTVRNDSVARMLERQIGERVAISYEQHRGVPFNCFGETQYYVTDVRTVAK